MKIVKPLAGTAFQRFHFIITNVSLQFVIIAFLHVVLTLKATFSKPHTQLHPQAGAKKERQRASLKNYYETNGLF
jgi:hypothetical protein